MKALKVKDRPATWPRCPNCGKLAPEQQVERSRELSADEFDRAVVLRKRRSAGEQLSKVERVLADTCVGYHSGENFGIMRWTEPSGRPRSPWGYPIPASVERFCTMQCALEFARFAYLSGYTRLAGLAK